MTSDLTPADELRAAAATARSWVAADSSTAWAPSAIAAFGPDLATVFNQWARLADLDPDLLNRIGGQETLATARAINATAGGQP